MTDNFAPEESLLLMGLWYHRSVDGYGSSTEKAATAMASNR